MTQIRYTMLTLLLFFPLFAQDIYYAQPTDLLNKHRLSIVGKYIFVKHHLLNVKSKWADEIYYAHLYAINKCSGDRHQLNPDGEMIAIQNKNNIEAYKKAFHHLITSMKSKGFDASESVIFQGANTILDGEHRLACSLYLQLLVPCKKSNKPDWMHSYTADYFRSQRVPEKYLDNMALEYSKLKKNCYIVSLFSKARSNDKQVKAILNTYGSIVYEKETTLTKEGPFNLMKLFYMGESWFGTWENNFPGAYGKGSACFNLNNPHHPTHVYLFECSSLEKVRECKKEIRELFRMHNDSVHVNDTHEETVHYAQTYFNTNSLHFLNHAKPKKFKNFLMLIDQYKEWIQQNNIDPDCLCIDGSAVLSAYGIRDCNDLDILHHGYEHEMQSISYKLIGSHNDEIHYHPVSKDEVIFNPQYHFYFKGLKFTSLDTIKEMKQKRNEVKDRNDVASIKAYE